MTVRIFPPENGEKNERERRETGYQFLHDDVGLYYFLDDRVPGVAFKPKVFAFTFQLGTLFARAIVRTSLHKAQARDALLVVAICSAF